MPEREIIMTKTTININERATLEVEGTYTTKSCKTVICLDNGNRYARAIDAAKANGTTIDGISHNCCGDTKHTNGKHFCYLKNVDEYLNTILDNFSSAVTENEALVTEIAALKAEVLELTARNSEYATEDALLRKRIETLNAQNIDLTKEVVALRNQNTDIPADILFKANEYDKIVAKRKAEEKAAALKSKHAELMAMMQALEKEMEASNTELLTLQSNISVGVM